MSEGKLSRAAWHAHHRVEQPLLEFECKPDHLAQPNVAATGNLRPARVWARAPAASSSARQASASALHLIDRRIVAEHGQAVRQHEARPEQGDFCAAVQPGASILDR